MKVELCRQEIYQNDVSVSENNLQMIDVEIGLKGILKCWIKLDLINRVEITDNI